MKKSDLKFGMVVELKNGSLCLVAQVKNTEDILVENYLKEFNDDTIYFMNIKTSGLETDLSCFDADLNHREGSNWDFSIVRIYEDYTLKNLLWERKEPLLTNEEREWLSAVIKPFRDKVDKIYIDGYSAEYLNIEFKNGDNFTSVDIDNIPYKFEGLEKDKEYTLGEIGL